MSRQLNIRFLGAARTVTGSKTVLEYNEKKYLIDCGLFQGPYEIRKQNWDPIEEAKSFSAVFLTHAHIDHSGYLPKLVKEGFRGKIYCSHPTADLCKILLMDAAKLQEEDAAFANRTRYSKYDPALPLYTASDAQKALDHLYTVDYHQWIQIDEHLSVQYSRSGHILGSSFIQFHFNSEQGEQILTFSGDLGNDRSFVIESPEPIKETDFLVMEATYGDRIHPPSDPKEDIAQIVRKVIGRGGTLVIPAFSLGRTQELIHIIHLLEQENKIPLCPVYLDSPMAKSVTSVYKKYPEELKSNLRRGIIEKSLTSANYKAIEDTDQSMLLCMSSEPKIVISAAGMLTGGRILHHLKAKLSDEKSGVLFVGYQAQGTKGLLLKNGLRRIRIHHKDVDVEAEIFNIESMSAHADSDEIINFINRMARKPRKTFLNHGEENSLNSLRYRIQNELHIDSVVAEPNKSYQL